MIPAVGEVEAEPVAPGALLVVLASADPVLLDAGADEASDSDGVAADPLVLELADVVAGSVVASAPLSEPPLHAVRARAALATVTSPILRIC
ncbi:hypothetical protein ACQP1U_02375 [Actinomycetota bacterium]